LSLAEPLRERPEAARPPSKVLFVI
jgi:hypothetical protein